jgi:outer membrane protein with beta-barrel domain
MSFFRPVLITLALLAFTPAAARADGMIIPFFGVNFGGDSGKELEEGVDADRFTWGASFTYMGGGVVGVEGDIGYSPDFFGKTDAGGSSVLTLTGNLLLGVPFGGQSGFGVRPYALVGIGVVRPDREEVEEDLLDFGEYKPAWNFGGGIMMFFASHVGVRADVRYFRTFEAVELFPVDVDEPGDDLDFTRGSVGLILRF